MRKSYLIYKLACVALFAIALQSCKKEDGIDNDSIIKKPYSLYVADGQGSLLNSNNGTDYKTIFPPDGYRMRSITTSENNLLFIKSNVHLSENNGDNFNPTYLFANPVAFWQSMMLTVPDHQRIYMSSIQAGSKGIVFSDDNGKKWTVDTSWDDNVVGGNINSFARLQNGALFCHGSIGDSIYKRDNKTDKWSYIEPTTPLPNAGLFYINHYNNAIIASDFIGANGVYGSADDGKTWNQYPGLPSRPIYATASPFDQVLLVGTDSMGVYRYQGGSFIPSNNGLGVNTTVFAIVGKDDIYKNDAVKRYIYLATDKGLFRSEDLGNNWSLVKAGVYTALY